MGQKKNSIPISEEAESELLSTLSRQILTLLCEQQSFFESNNLLHLTQKEIWHWLCTSCNQRPSIIPIDCLDTNEWIDESILNFNSFEGSHLSTCNPLSNFSTINKFHVLKLLSRRLALNLWLKIKEMLSLYM